jgi:tetratricopeptide (TPR) repeat protein
MRKTVDKRMIPAVPLVFIKLIILLLGVPLCVQAQVFRDQISQENPGFPYDYFAVPGSSPEVQLYLRHTDDFHTNLVQSRIRENNITMALGDLKYALDRFPNHPKGLMLAGVLARLTQSPMLAITYYEKALKLYPQHALTHAQYGLYLVDIGRAGEGIEKLERAIAMDPKLASAHAWLAKAYAQSGNTDRARQAATRARELGYRGQIAVGSKN